MSTTPVVVPGWPASAAPPGMFGQIERTKVLHVAQVVELIAREARVQIATIAYPPYHAP